MSDDIFRNGRRPPIRVSFYRLCPIGPDPEELSHKSACPACPGGMLLMARDSRSGALLAEDRCTSCGQAVVYEDIEKVRKERP